MNVNWRYLKMAKMDKKWVVLCSTAVAAVYTAAYVSTEAQANANQQTPQALVHVQKGQSQPNGFTINNNQTNNSTANNNSTNSNQTNAGYKNGTYTGTGMNRRGSIEVAVTIKNNKIKDVEISQFEMHYSERDVVGLPSEVVQNQSPYVQNVSGATYSTQAFEEAVQNALDQAQKG